MLQDPFHREKGFHHHLYFIILQAERGHYTELLTGKREEGQRDLEVETSKSC